MDKILPLSAAFQFIVHATIICRAVNNQENKRVPPPLEQRYPKLLDENDVIHYVDSGKEFVVIGDGSFADVYLGEMKESGKQVVVKTFRDSSFEDIMEEVRIHRYAQQFIHTPRLLGLLPTGPLTTNISIVYDYIPNAKSLSDWMRCTSQFSHEQWLNICLQIAENLNDLHERDVIHNDFHTGNILVQVPNKKMSNPNIFVLDLGLATYKRGRDYNFDPDFALEEYPFIAPELVPSAADENLPRYSANILKNRRDRRYRPKSERESSKGKDVVGTKKHSKKPKKYNLNKVWNTITDRESRALFGSRHILNQTNKVIKCSRDKSLKENVQYKTESLDRMQKPIMTEVVSTRATDIFSLGMALEHIANHTGMDSLQQLASQCQNINPNLRPTLQHVITGLRRLLNGREEQKIQEQHNYITRDQQCGSMYMDCTSSSLQKSQDPHAFQRYTISSKSDILKLHSKRNRYNISRKQNAEQLRSNPFQQTKGCPLELMIIDPDDILPPQGMTWDDDEIWLSTSGSSRDATMAADLLPNREPVVIKQFYKVDFEIVRDEACITHYLGGLGIVPQVFGILVMYDSMRDASFVQERFGQGVTLSQFANESDHFEWDKKGLLKIAMGFDPAILPGSTKSEKDRSSYTLQQFWHILNLHHKGSTCQGKAPRRQLFEQILKDVAKMVKVMHQKGLLLNTLNPSDILLAVQNDVIVTKFVNTDSVSALDAHHDYPHLKNSEDQLRLYIAPELNRREAPSVSSDTFSFCKLVDYLLWPYISVSPYYGPNLEQSRNKKLSELVLQCIHGVLTERPRLNEFIELLSYI